MTVANASDLCYNYWNENPINKAAPEGVGTTNGSLTTMKGVDSHGS